MPTPHDQTINLQATINGQPLRVISKPGLPEWNIVTPVQALLAEHARLAGGERVLLLGCDHGALAVAVARQWFGISTANSVRRSIRGVSTVAAPAQPALAGPVEIALTCSDDNLIALQMTARTLQANALPPANLVPPLELGGPYEVVIIRLPKGRKLARRWLLEAHAALIPGGVCYLGGANPEGIQSVLKDAAELFGGVSILGYRKGCRVGRMVKPGGDRALPGWAHLPGIAPHTWHEFEIIAGGAAFQIHSLPGVFSFDGLDEGSRLLLENLSIPAGGRVLDFGCGCGILGMAASRMGAAQVDLVDVNLLAVAAAQENLRLNGISHGRVLASDLLQAVSDQRYDLIITNPPFHAGHAVNTDITQTFLAQAQACLAPGGALILVANRFLRYDLFGQVETLAANQQYHVLKARRITLA